MFAELKLALIFLVLASVSVEAASVIVGSSRPLKTISEGIAAMVPLGEDLYVYVEEASLSYSKPQGVSAQSNWNGFKVRVIGIKNAPEITVYSGGDAVYEFNGANLSLAYENINGPLGNEGRLVGGDPFYYVKDHLGSTRMTLNKDASVVESNWYQSMGNMTSLVSGSQPTREKFTGKERDMEGADGAASGINLDYFGARYYDADLGMWTSPDQARQFLSLYSYGTNPLNSIDPNGRLQVYSDGFGDQHPEICLDGDAQTIHYIGSGDREWFTYKFPSTQAMDWLGIDSYGVSVGGIATTVVGMRWGVNYQYFRSTGEFTRFEYLGGTIGAELSYGISINYAWFIKNGNPNAVADRSTWYGPFREASGNAGKLGFGYFMGVVNHGDPYWIGVNGGTGAGAGFSYGLRVDYEKSIMNNPNYQFPQ